MNWIWWSDIKKKIRFFEYLNFFLNGRAAAAGGRGGRRRAGEQKTRVSFLARCTFGNGQIRVQNGRIWVRGEFNRPKTATNIC